MIIEIKTNPKVESKYFIEITGLRVKDRTLYNRYFKFSGYSESSEYTGENEVYFVNPQGYVISMNHYMTVLSDQKFWVKDAKVTLNITK